MLKATPDRHGQLTDTTRLQSLGYRHETGLADGLQKMYQAYLDGLG